MKYNGYFTTEKEACKLKMLARFGNHTVEVAQEAFTLHMSNARPRVTLPAGTFVLQQLKTPQGQPRILFTDTSHEALLHLLRLLEEQYFTGYQNLAQQLTGSCRTHPVTPTPRFKCFMRSSAA